MKQPFRTIVIGGTGQVGGAAVQALLASPSCQEVVMLTRKPVDNPDPKRLRNVVLDTAAAEFPTQVAMLSKAVVAAGDHVAGVSCVGVGSGSLRWSEEELRRLELGVVGGFAQGLLQAGVKQFCLLSAIGANAQSRVKYVRVMGQKEEAIKALGFTRLAIFRPGIIVGNAHTPRWAEIVGKLVPGPMGNVQQDDIGCAIATEIATCAEQTGTAYYNNQAMRARVQAA